MGPKTADIKNIKSTLWIFFSLSLTARRIVASFPVCCVSSHRRCCLTTCWGSAWRTRQMRRGEQRWRERKTPWRPGPSEAEPGTTTPWSSGTPMRHPDRLFWKTCVKEIFWYWMTQRLDRTHRLNPVTDHQALQSELLFASSSYFSFNAIFELIQLNLILEQCLIWFFLKQFFNLIIPGLFSRLSKTARGSSDYQRQTCWASTGSSWASSMWKKTKGRCFGTSAKPSWSWGTSSDRKLWWHLK